MQGKPDQRNARGLTTALAGVAVLLAPLGCAKQVQEIKVGEYSSLTGDKATFGISTHNGIQMALDAQNAAGGIGGVQVRLIAEVHQGKPDYAAPAVQQLASQDQLVAMLGMAAPCRKTAAERQLSTTLLTPRRKARLAHAWHTKGSSGAQRGRCVRDLRCADSADPCPGSSPVSG